MKIYLKSMRLPSPDAVARYMADSEEFKLNGVYKTYYPFGLFERFSDPPCFEFSPITVFYGGNGSGKSTLLNIIAEELGLDRNAPYSTTDFFDDYLRMCAIECEDVPHSSRIITSDDIFRSLSDTRGINRGVDEERHGVVSSLGRMRHEIIEDPSVLQLRGLDDYDRWKEYKDAVHKSASRFIRERAHQNLILQSNGETALRCLTENITENALYLLDEPENSLSPQFQLELKQFLEESARFWGCQFVISTHSPLLLALEHAVIYNLDDKNAAACEWYELENVKVYAEFFLRNADKFSAE